MGNDLRQLLKYPIRLRHGVASTRCPSVMISIAVSRSSANLPTTTSPPPKHMSTSYIIIDRSSSSSSWINRVNRKMSKFIRYVGTHVHLYVSRENMYLEIEDQWIQFPWERNDITSHFTRFLCKFISVSFHLCISFGFRFEFECYKISVRFEIMIINLLVFIGTCCCGYYVNWLSCPSIGCRVVYTSVVGHIKCLCKSSKIQIFRKLSIII